MMNQTEIGKFIARCRKEKNLTQAQLAEKLNITDRAISKWETGKSMPDSSIMLELCEILGITVNELLSGAKAGMEGFEKKADENLLVLKVKDKTHRKSNGIFSLLFSVTLLLGILVCLICNIAISGHLSWSLIPISSMVFAWAITFPIMRMGKRGLAAGLISLSIFILPYLYLLSHLTKTKDVFSVGAVMATASMVFLWIIAFVFRCIGKARRYLALGITFLLAVPFLFFINVLLSRRIETSLLDLWDVLTVFILLLLAFVSFICDHVRKKDTCHSTT